MSLKWFCNNETNGLSSVIKIAIFDAAYLYGKSNGGSIDNILAVVSGISALVGKEGSTEESLNVIIKDAIKTYINMIEDPLIKANVLAVLSEMNFDIDLPESTLPTEKIKDLLESFSNGITAAKAV